MNYNEGCTICGRELLYNTDYSLQKCFICGSEYSSNASCPEGHFICDNCHSHSAFDLIEQFCTHTNITDPVKIINLLMKQPQVKMHGPEHHFLVPAALIAAYYSFHGDEKVKKKKIKSARARSARLPGGFCGTHGNCGAAVGTGIFISLITGATPLSENEWKLSNKITGQALLQIAEQGGPRCCKRDSFIAIFEVVEFLKENFSVELPLNKVQCEFHRRNKQCLASTCTFYPN